MDLPQKLKALDPADKLRAAATFWESGKPDMERLGDALVQAAIAEEGDIRERAAKRDRKAVGGAT